MSYLVTSYRNSPKANIAFGLLGVGLIGAGALISLALARIKPFEGLRGPLVASPLRLDVVAYGAGLLTLASAPKVIEMVAAKQALERDTSRSLSGGETMEESLPSSSSASDLSTAKSKPSDQESSSTTKVYHDKKIDLTLLNDGTSAGSCDFNITQEDLNCLEASGTSYDDEPPSSSWTSSPTGDATFAHLAVKVSAWVTPEGEEALQALEEQFDAVSHPCAPFPPVSPTEVTLNGRRYLAMPAPNHDRGSQIGFWNYLDDKGVQNLINLRESNDDYPDYWPKVGKELFFKEGGMTIRNEREKTIACPGAASKAKGTPYIVKRSFKITTASGKKRVINQWHVRFWEDGASPDPAVLIALLDQQEIVNDKGLLAVHCWRGVGRTGTCIMARELRCQIVEERQEEVNLMLTRKLANKQRWLVQTFSQFLSLYAIGRRYAERVKEEDSPRARGGRREECVVG